MEVEMSYAGQIEYHPQPVRDSVSTIQNVVSILKFPKWSRTWVTLPPATFLHFDPDLQAKGYTGTTRLKKTSKEIINQYRDILIPPNDLVYDGTPIPLPIENKGNADICLDVNDIQYESEYYPIRLDVNRKRKKGQEQIRLLNLIHQHLEKDQAEMAPVLMIERKQEANQRRYSPSISKKRVEGRVHAS